MPIITVDGEELEVPEGRTILQAFDDLGLLADGVEVPHYCWHPKLSIDGSCRMCQVEVEGLPKLQIACNTPVADGMVIHTKSDRVRQAREGVMELLLVNHPLDCPICDQAGECSLQDYAVAYGRGSARTREPRRAGRKRVELGPEIVFDEERCILCRRCVRFCREIPGTGELGVLERGDRSVIDTFPGESLDNDYSMNVADICPVGALTTRDFRFRVRVWFLEDSAGLCTGCARGCNVNVGVSKGRAWRYTPRRNDDVNDTWLCDAGRLSYHQIGSADRLTEAATRDERGQLQRVDYAKAISAAAEQLRRVVDVAGPGAVAAIASPHMTNEDLLALRRFLAALGTAQTGVCVARGRSDALLLHEEKAANAAGARLLGFSEGGALLERIRGGATSALIVMGRDVLAPEHLGAAGAEALSDLDPILLLDTHRSALERVAHVVLPTRHAAEKTGTFVNWQGRMQRVSPALRAPGAARDEGQVLHDLGRALGLPGFEGSFDPLTLSRALGEAHPAFAGLHWDSIGDAGAPVAASPPAEGPV